MKASYPFFDALEAGGIHSTPLSRVAEIIARQYADIQCQERGSDWRILSDLEQKIVEAVRPALVQSASPKNILLGQQHIFDQVKQEVDEMVSELPQQDLQWLWKEVNVSPGDSIGYDDLDAICFTETDEVAPHIGTWPLK